MTLTSRFFPLRLRRDLFIGLVASVAAHAAMVWFGHGRSAGISLAPSESWDVPICIFPAMDEIEEFETDLAGERSAAPAPDASAWQIAEPAFSPSLASFCQVPCQLPWLDQLPLVQSIGCPPLVPAGLDEIDARLGAILDSSRVDQLPAPVFQPDPVYPTDLPRGTVAGRVLVEFLVDAHGAVLNPVVLTATHRAFARAALEAVINWQFRPGSRGGIAVNTRMQVPIVFSITNEPE